MKRTLVIVFFLLVLLAVAPPSLHWSEADSHKTLELCIGQTAKLGLPVDETDRCPWLLDSLDDEIIEIGQAETVQQNGPLHVSGAEQCVWPVTAVEKGRTTLVARQQCGKNAPPHRKTVTFDILVKDAGYLMSLN